MQTNVTYNSTDNFETFREYLQCHYSLIYVLDTWRQGVDLHNSVTFKRKLSFIFLFGLLEEKCRIA